MQTYTHFIWTLALSKTVNDYVTRKGWTGTKIPEFHRRGLLFGSILPDLSLIVVAVVCILTDLISGSAYTTALFDDWYFHSPYMRAAHNLFHSPVSLAMMTTITLLCWSMGKNRNLQAWWFISFFFWCLCGSWFHALLDIPVHHDDGPLLLFPFNWTISFHSPVSYWDPDYYGLPFSIFEHTLDVVLIVWMCHRCCRRRKERREGNDYDIDDASSKKFEGGGDLEEARGSDYGSIAAAE